MRAAVFYDTDDIRYDDVPTPEVGPGEILVDLKTAGLCGTDIHKIVHRTVPAGTVLGHEVAGVVRAVGDGVTAFAPGDRVYGGHHIPCFTCRECVRGNQSLCRQFRETNFDPGGYAETFRLLPVHVKNNLYRIPDEAPFVHAAMVEPVATVVRGFQRLSVHAGDVAVVMGSGPIGVIWAQMLKHAGCHEVICSDVSPFRLEMARALGATATVRVGKDDLAATVRERSDGRGADVVVIAAGVPALLSEAVSITGPGADVLVFAGMDRPVEIDPSRFFNAEIRIIGAYSSVPTDYETAMSLVERGVVNVDEMITHRFPLSRLGDAVRIATDPSGEAMKIVLYPDEE